MPHAYRTHPLPPEVTARCRVLDLPEGAARTLAHGLRQCRPDVRKFREDGGDLRFPAALDAWRDAVESVASSIACDSDDAFDLDLFKYGCNW